MCIIYKYKVHLNIRITQKVHALISIVGGKVACALMKQCNNYIKLDCDEGAPKHAQNKANNAKTQTTGGITRPATPRT